LISSSNCWIDGYQAENYPSRMPTLELSNDELRDAAQAARAAAHRAQQDAAAQPNPRITATFQADAERYAQLAERFERVRHDVS
jgi:hypothetical protein